MARASGRADRADGTDPFPWLVTLGCLVVAVGLFLHSTMPALAEQQDLQKAETRLREDLDRVQADAAASRRRAQSLLDDPEAIRVQLDAKGLLPQEAIDLFAQEPPATDDATAKAATPPAPTGRGR